MITTGTLWIYYEDQDEYYVYDFSAKSFSIVKAPPPDCDKTPLINSLDVICRSDGHASIFNLLSEERRVLSITDADFVWQQNSIPELLFYLKRDINLNEGYFSYNLSSGESKYLITLPLEGFETLPKFSSSGDYAVAVKNDEVIKIDLGTGEYTALFSGDEHATFNLWWSPTLPMVAFGVMNYIPLDVGHRANLIYSLEPETGAIKQLFPTEELKAYFSETDEWPIWSPSGDNFIAIAYERLFVINVSGEIIMIQTKSNISAEGYPIGDIAWSPDGEYIAFFEYPNGYLDNTNLIIYSMKENRLFEVIENEAMSSVFWR